MKKMFFFGMFLLAVTIGFLMTASNVHAEASETTDPSEMAFPPETVGPDETLVQTLLQKTDVTQMIFKGKGERWNYSLIVMGKVGKPVGTQKQFTTKVALTPKSSKPSDYVYMGRWIEYRIGMGNEWINGGVWLSSENNIALDTNALNPYSSQPVTIYIRDGAKNEGIQMSNVIPEGAISPEEALRIALNVHYKTFGTYPTEYYDFNIQFSEPKYWVVSFDDNDGIGGRGYLMINALTGNPGDIKIDE